MTIARRLLLTLLPMCAICCQAFAWSVSLRGEPAEDVLVVAFPAGSNPEYSVRRTGAREISAVLAQEGKAISGTLPHEFSGRLVERVLATDDGVTIQLKTAAFGMVSLPGKTSGQLEIHIFSDAIGARWDKVPEKLRGWQGARMTALPDLPGKPAMPVLMPKLAETAPAKQDAPASTLTAEASAKPAEPAAAPEQPVAQAQEAPAEPSPAASRPEPTLAEAPKLEPAQAETPKPEPALAEAPKSEPTQSAPAAPALPAAPRQADALPQIQLPASPQRLFAFGNTTAPDAAMAKPEPARPDPAKSALLKPEAMPSPSVAASDPDDLIATLEAALPAPTARALAPGDPQPLVGGPRLSLREALDMALKENPRMQATQSRAKSTEHTVDSARGALLPHAQVTGSLSKVTNPNNQRESDSDYVNQIGRVWNLQVSQNIFDGLVRLSNYARAKLVSARASQEKRKTELDTIEAVQREYFKLIRTRSDIKTFRTSVGRLKNQREAAYAFYKVEMAPRLTLLQVETSLAQTEQRLSKALNDEQVQLVKLNALLGQQGGTAYDFAGDLKTYTYDQSLDFEECLAKAQKSLPEVVIAKADAEIAQEELNLTEGKVYPRLDATAAYIKQDTDYRRASSTDLDRQYYTMGLNLSWEIFSGGEQYYEIQARKKLLQASQSELANLMLTVRSLVRENYLNTLEAKNQIRIALMRTREAEEAYEQASMRFRSGIGTNLDVLDAHEKITASESAFNQAQADYLTSMASLFRVMGEREMNLALLAGAHPGDGK